MNIRLLRWGHVTLIVAASHSLGTMRSFVAHLIHCRALVPRLSFVGSYSLAADLSHSFVPISPALIGVLLHLHSFARYCSNSFVAIRPLAGPPSLSFWPVRSLVPPLIQCLPFARWDHVSFVVPLPLLSRTSLPARRWTPPRGLEQRRGEGPYRPLLQVPDPWSL
jgi:hypothetical protein